MPAALTNARVLLDNAFHEGLAVLVEGRRIAAIAPEGDVPPNAERIDLGGAMLAPGFIDTQVNGGGGVLFNDDPTVDGIRTIGAAHARFGTTGFFPTLISDELDVIRAGIAAVDAAIAEGVPGVLGIHIEGPFINLARKGIHAAERIRALTDEGLAVLTSLRHGRTLVTLAPEETTPDMIGRLVDAGVVVAAGHTNGSYRQIRDAMDAGLTGFTHLFNAMSQLGSREPGAVGAALESDRSHCGIIVDGHHVSPVTLKLALRCKPHDQFMLVTDAMPTIGSDMTSFDLHGRTIRVEEGRLLSADGTLAGSHLDMMGAVRNAVGMLDVPLAQAIVMASAAPADFMGLKGQVGRIAIGEVASLVAIGDDLRVRRSWIDGQALSRA
ncbi:N-acetylglucosamine-6-phosphate deacetylase [uncultured Sphingomonas sp.]|uniref:N-acetylglucosamine-6-phosphate deacetylase n=1 Tax=uncultured Sphingomonas sp. TaxID=158754 RepID=UPI0025F0E690|nr:N-acetylglucosamine-6-phosphate deacetylase [uncultured Sphingomonas sp.]